MPDDAGRKARMGRESLFTLKRIKAKSKVLPSTKAHLANPCANVLISDERKPRPMRWVVVLLLPLLSGCLGDSPLGHVERDCSEDTQITVGAHRELLVPASTPDQARLVEGPARATVTAREGQTLVAQVTYSVLGGQVNVLFNGPHDNQATTDNTWTSQGEVSAGDYTLELEGAPFAFEVTYTMVLMAVGCTPV